MSNVMVSLDKLATGSSSPCRIFFLYNLSLLHVTSWSTGRVPELRHGRNALRISDGLPEPVN
ncbi:MAG: hypothetical protein IPG99_00055 [Ignavibacteria bacterium]|nr:hypothetical protein [Ignavibacteria bacterium]